MDGAYLNQGVSTETLKSSPTLSYGLGRTPARSEYIRHIGFLDDSMCSLSSMLTMSPIHGRILAGPVS